MPPGRCGSRSFRHILPLEHSSTGQIPTAKSETDGPHRRPSPRRRSGGIVFRWAGRTPVRPADAHRRPQSAAHHRKEL